MQQWTFFCAESAVTVHYEENSRFIGQEAFAAEQLTELGKVDLAVMQFCNRHSQMNLNKNKGFKLTNASVVEW